MLRVAFAGTFPASLEQPVRRHLGIACEIVVTDEASVIAQLADVGVVVTMALTAEMGRAATRLKLVQVPGAGLDRIDRSALPDGVSLANVYGHETGIAEYVIGVMLALTRDFSRVDTALRAGEWQSQWSVGVAPPPVWPELAGKTLGILGYGRIGQAVARRARAFDMNVCAIRRDVRRSTEDEPGFLGGSGVDWRGAQAFRLRADFDAGDHRYHRVDRSRAARLDEADGFSDQRSAGGDRR